MEKKKKITWITAECFIDVDLPIIPVIANVFDISWMVCKESRSKLDHGELIRKNLCDKNVNLNFFSFTKRQRNPLLFLEFLKLIRQIKKNKADLYYFDIPGMPYLMPLVDLLFDKRKVLIATHNVSTPDGAVRQGVADLYMRYTLKRFKNIHVFSNYQKAILQRRCPGKNILLAPLALKDYGPESVVAGSLVTFLNFGIIREYKRIDVLIEAAQQAYERLNKRFLVKIYGACLNWEKYQRLIKYPFLFELRIEPIPNNEIANLFCSSHYFVLPYQDIAQSGAMTVAFNYNIPVIASELEGFKEFIDSGENGILFKPASVSDLCNVICYVLQNHPEKYESLKSKQKELVLRNYDINRIVKMYSDFINSL